MGEIISWIERMIPPVRCRLGTESSGCHVDKAVTTSGMILAANQFPHANKLNSRSSVLELIAIDGRCINTPNQSSTVT